MMQYEKISAWEKRVKSSGNNGIYTIKSFSIPIKNDQNKLDGYLISPASKFQGYFYAEKVKKEKIVLHFTAGYLTGDFSVLMNKQRGHVSVPFVLARDGSIYRPFSSAYWSYHLGKSAKGGNKVESKKSIGIELSNIGYLVLDEANNNLNSIYGRPYCSLDDTHLYTKLEKPFRGQNYYATFTEEQYDSLIILLRYLTTEYNIAREFLAPEDRYQFTDKVLGFSGILSHINYRKNGKWDIGPAFDWERLIAGVTAEEFTPTTAQRQEAKTRGMSSSTKDLENQHTPDESNDPNVHDYGEDGPDDGTEILHQTYSEKDNNS